MPNSLGVNEGSDVCGGGGGGGGVCVSTLKILC